MSAARSIFRLKLQSLSFGEAGQDLVEYALLVSLIALAVISGVNQVAGSVASVFSNVSTSLTSAQHHDDDH